MELINISTDARTDRVGLARDVSASGMRFDSVSKFAVGERVHVMIHVASAGAQAAMGRVVRASGAPDYASLYPHSAAVEFDVPCFDLDESLRERTSALDIAKFI